MSDTVVITVVFRGGSAVLLSLTKVVGHLQLYEM